MNTVNRDILETRLQREGKFFDELGRAIAQHRAAVDSTNEIVAFVNGYFSGIRVGLADHLSVGTVATLYAMANPLYITEQVRKMTTTALETREIGLKKMSQFGITGEFVSQHPIDQAALDFLHSDKYVSKSFFVSAEKAFHEVVRILIAKEDLVELGRQCDLWAANVAKAYEFRDDIQAAYSVMSDWSSIERDFKRVIRHNQEQKLNTETKRDIRNFLLVCGAAAVIGWAIGRALSDD